MPPRQFGMSPALLYLICRCLHPLTPTRVRGPPCRFANLPSGAKILLKTGHEPVLGVREGPSTTATTPATTTNSQQQQPIREKNPSPAPTTTAATTTAATETKSKGSVLDTIHVFTRASEYEEDASHPPQEELPDEWYEVSEADVRAQLAGYASRRAADGTQHLMTRQMRENEVARKAVAFGSVPVRVEFPNAIVIQCSFAASAPVQELRDLVASLLVPTASDCFYLFTTPPKTEMKDVSVSFYAAGLIPAARIHVGLKKEIEGDCLREEVRSMIGKPPSRAETIGVEKKKKQRGKEVAVTSAKDEEQGGGSGGGSGGASSSKAGAGSGGASGGATKRGAGGVPSWMKLSAG